jgi:hypothetical protein
VTLRRHTAYRRVRAKLGVLATDVQLCVEERLLFDDCAEGLLLARAGEDEEVRSLRLKAAIGLSLLVGSGRVSDAQADELYEQITNCGPADMPLAAAV